MDQAEAAELQQLAARHLWMPFSNVSDLADSGPRVFVRAEGSWMWDSGGRKYLDACAAFETCAIGHSRGEVADAIAAQVRTIENVEAFSSTTPPAIRLAAQVAALAPAGMSRVLFTPGGSEAIEAAIKIARQYHLNRGDALRAKVISRVGAYHGSTLGALALDGGSASHQRILFEPLAPPTRLAGITHRPRCLYCRGAECDLRCADDFERLILVERPETVSAVIVDPAACSAGVAIPPAEYLPRLREICDRHGVLLIADEIITGFGRTGTWFMCQQLGVVPDLITISKGLSSGYSPIGGVVAADHVAEAFAGRAALSHGLTFGGHPPSCAAALANLAIFEREQLVARCADLGPYFREALGRLERHDTVKEVRSVGLLARVELAMTGAEGRAVRDRCLELGVVLLVAAPGNTLFMCPPLTITTDEIDHIVTVVDRALGAAA